MSLYNRYVDVVVNYCHQMGVSYIGCYFANVAEFPYITADTSSKPIVGLPIWRKVLN